MTADRPTLSAADFAAKWRENARRESASSQEHFIDLCRMLGVQTPNEADPTGEHYSFEAGAERTSTGGTGAADVWKRGHFGLATCLLPHPLPPGARGPAPPSDVRAPLRSPLPEGEG